VIFNEKAKEFTKLTGYSISCRKVLRWLDDLPKGKDEFDWLYECYEWEKALGLEKNDLNSEESKRITG